MMDVVGTKLLFEWQLKSLDVMIDPHMCFSSHIRQVAVCTIPTYTTFDM